MSDVPTGDTSRTRDRSRDPQSRPARCKMPPGPRLPKLVQGIGFALSRNWTYQQIARRHGDVFTMNLPMFGRTVIVADPQLAKQLFMASTDDVGNVQPNLSRVLGKRVGVRARRCRPPAAGASC